VDPPLADLLSELALTVSRGIERLEILHKEKEHASLVAALIDNADSGILLLEGGVHPGSQRDPGPDAGLCP
jgi:hypothetical protein